MLLEQYLQNPCKMLSIPFWKAKNLDIPPNMVIVHDNDFQREHFKNYYDDIYFRLYHNLKSISSLELKGYEIITAGHDDINSIVKIINRSYTDIQVDENQIESYTRTKAYQSDLWILIEETASNGFVGCGIADYDSEARELILEWIQVLPEYRRRKIGQLIVNELLRRMSKTAMFATVSGRVNNITEPEKLYRKCGFVGNDIWHILKKIN